ncbi:MAG: enoyl-CoA hydratase/isomerase family protein [Candidatus Bathyarchaeia archaeon]
MEFKNILYEKSEGIATITINRPKRLNALNQETIQEILSALDDIEKDANIRVVVITGAGGRAFSAGADISGMKGRTPLDSRRSSHLGQQMMNKVEDLEKPVIAAINGYALGGGLELAMACDFRIASENARLGQPEINIGLIPGWGGTQRLPRFVGKALAKEMIFTGKMIDAKTAEQHGLVNKVVPADQLESAVEQLAEELINKPPVAIKVAKQLINNSTETNLRIGLTHESEAFGILGSTEDFKEGTAAFLEKRKPKFKGK